MASPSPAGLPPLAKLIASAGFRNLECLRMYASGFLEFSAGPTPLVRGYDHFLALLGWCDMLAARQIEELCAGAAGTGPDITVGVAGGKLMSAFVRAVES